MYQKRRSARNSKKGYRRKSTSNKKTIHKSDRESELEMEIISEYRRLIKKAEIELNMSFNKESRKIDSLVGYLDIAEEVNRNNKSIDDGIMEHDACENNRCIGICKEVKKMNIDNKDL
eukprot:GHVP01031562.1.p1 GENE.GHVP01031562.1~~GHVP01031562.1.p1  ORF type:complete len:118 (+),score=26.50 GHVP01031562.1:199-552(+)